MKRFIVVESAGNIYIYDRNKKKGYKQIGNEVVSIKVNNEIAFSKIVIYMDKEYEADKLPLGFNLLI